MKTLFISLILLVLSMVANTVPVLAHAIHAAFDTGGVVVSASFTDDIPAAGVFVSVFAPDETERFLSGKTDRNGCFAFMPDREGEWDVLVSDRLGHRLQVNVLVDSSLLPEKAKDEVGFWFSKGQKIVAGFAVITLFFGCFGLLNKWLKRGGEK